MIDKFRIYFTKLETLSDEDLDRSAEGLVRNEKMHIAKLIAHLAEMSERKTALELGYSSIYDYCTRRLNLSKGAVPARVHVANVSRRFPELLAALAENRISLTVASLLAAHVKEDNVDTLIADCTGKTREETELYLVGLKPKPVFQSSIRKKPSRPNEPAPTTPSEPVFSALPSAPPSPSLTILEPAEPTVFNFRFSADSEFKAKFDRLAEVLGVVNGQRHMAEIFEKAIDVALEKKDPKKRLERRKKQQQARAARSRSNDVRPVSRRMPSERWERVHERGQYQCEYVSDSGRRCTRHGWLRSIT